MNFETHRVRLDSSDNNVIFDFKELVVECIITDTSYEAHGLIDMVNLDLSAEIQQDPSFAPVMRSESAFSYESTAQLFIPIDIFQDLFLMKITKQDVVDDDYEHIFFALDHTKWCQNDYIIPFHNARVDPSYALNPNARILKQNIQNDFIRSIYFDITGNLKFCSLFKNTPSLLQNMKAIDTSIHTIFETQIASIGGTVDNPLSMNDTSNNPVRDFVFGMLGATNSKEYRKLKMLDALKTLENDSADTFVVVGTSFKGYGYYYPVYITKTHPDLYIGYKSIQFTEHGDENFYVNSMTLNTDLNSQNYPSDYVMFVGDDFITVPFVYGDGIQARIQYSPTDTLFGNRIVHARSYKVTMILSLEMDTSVSFSDASFVENSICGAAASHVSISGDEIDISGAYNFELLWLGSLDRSDAYFSHVHYYPQLDMIVSISLCMYMPSGGDALGVAFHCRPRVHEDGDRVVFDKAYFNIPSAKISYDAWRVYSMNDFEVLLNDDTTFSSVSSFFRTQINSTGTLNTFDMYFRGEQQIVSITCTGNPNNTMNCKIKDSSIVFDDGHSVALSSA